MENVCVLNEFVEFSDELDTSIPFLRFEDCYEEEDPYFVKTQNAVLLVHQKLPTTTLTKLGKWIGRFGDKNLSIVGELRHVPKWLGPIEVQSHSLSEFLAQG